ncbi:MAG: serine hydrolase domain-containing protein [Pseudomonadota bacterium]
MISLMLTVAVVLALIASAVWFGYTRALAMRWRRLRYQRSLFTGARQETHFVQQDRYYPVNRMDPGTQVVRLRPADPQTLPTGFEYGGAERQTQAFLDQSDTAALLVLHRGRTVHESYALTGGPDVAWLTHSVSKTVVGTAVGLAVGDGLVPDLEAPISRYVPLLERGGYRAVPVRSVLQMSSGIRWTEDYSDPASDLNQFGRTLFSGASYDDFVAARVAERPPDTRHNYTGMDAQALTMLVRAVTGTSLAQYLSERLWRPLGMQDPAYWTTDDRGVELGLGGLCASARDLAKLGELYRAGGQWQGQTLLDPGWIKQATTVQAPHLRRGPRDESRYTMGYGYQWWLPDGDDQDYTAIGIYNQFVYVNPAAEIVIVKLSAHRDYANPAAEEAYLELPTIALFRQIATCVAS